MTAKNETQGRLPTFITIGAMKCATTFLHEQLGCHPEIFTSEPKEVDYFLERVFHGKNEDWYRSHFVTEKPVIGESSTGYSKFPSGGEVPGKVHRLLPDLKIIYVVRDPLERIYSHFHHLVLKGTMSPDLDRLFDVLSPEHHLVYCSRYHFQLNRYLEYYAMSRFLIIDYAALLNTPEKVLNQCYEFLGVSKNRKRFLSGTVFNTVNSKEHRINYFSERRQTVLTGQGKAQRHEVLQTLEIPFANSGFKDRLDKETLRVLTEDAARLRQLTGMSFSSWQI